MGVRSLEIMRARRRRNLLCSPRRASLLALAAGPLTGGASSQTQPTPVPETGRQNPLAGNGMWIWYLNRSSHGKLGTDRDEGARARDRDRADQVGRRHAPTGASSHSSVVSGLHARGLNVCAWQFIYGRKPGKEARVGAAAVANGRRLPGARRRGSVRGQVPAGLDLHVVAALAWSVRTTRSGSPASRTSTTTRRCPTRSSSARAAPSTTSRSSTGRTSAPPSTPGSSTPGSGTGSTGGRSTPLGQVYNNPKAGQIQRFRALAMSHGFDGVSWWCWQSAGKRQWKAVGVPVSPAAAGPYPSYPFLHLGSKGDFVAWAQQLLAGGRVLGADQRLLPGLRRRRPCTRFQADPRPAPDRQPRRADLVPSAAERPTARPLDQAAAPSPRGRAGVWRCRRRKLGQAARGQGRDPAVPPSGAR